MQIIDISNWKDLEDKVTTGSRIKFWLENEADKKLFLFKIPKSEGELYAEVVAAILGEQLYEVNVPKTLIAKRKGEIGVLTPSFVNSKNGESFEEIIDYFGPDFDKDNLLEYTLEKAIAVIEAQGMLEKFYEMCIFDAIIGNQDRHCENWGILYDSDNKASFAPLYDNGSSLLNGLTEDKVERMLLDSNMADGYIRRAKTCFTINNKKRAKVVEMLTQLNQYNSLLFKSVFDKFCLRDFDEIYYVLKDIDDTILSDNRKKLIRKMIKKRTNIFYDYIIEKDE